jgi:adenylate cyclase
MPPLIVRVVEDGQDFECPLSRLELGRQDVRPGTKDLEDGPFALVSRAGGWQRLVVGWNSEPDVGRRQAALEALPDGRVRVTNLNPTRPLWVSDVSDPLGHQASVEVTPPFTVSLGRRTVYVSAPLSDPEPRTLLRKTIAPGLHRSPRVEVPQTILAEPRFDELIDWLQVTAGVLQSAVATADFVERAAEALVSIVGLHSGRVLLRENGKWRAAAAHRAEGVAEVGEPSDTVLRQLLAEPRVLWPPRQGPTTVVAAPLLNPDGEVIGALYGEVRRDEVRGRAGLDKLRALLVEMLANAVAAGLARREVENERTLLRQFFPAELADRLARDPGLIREPRESDISALFLDVRDSSALGERLGPVGTFEWISRVLGRLSECVMAERGVLVDYIGDELVAMWGAPEEQRDHARRAARAAQAMLGALGGLDRESRERWGVPTVVGIGLHSGKAMVGDIGSSHKRKYGPLGDTVNVASRIQGVTKYLKTTLLVSRETWEAGGDAAVARRVVKARLAGTALARDLYELAGADGKGEFFAASQEALSALEGGHFAEAAERAAALLRTHPGDGPLQLVLARAAHALVTGGEGFDPVWVPPGK